jgi:cytochrome b6-f complex iron-sulfur subunit
MSEEPPKPPSPDSPEEISRRRFFVKIGVGSVAVAALGTAAFSYEYLSPNVLYEPSPIVDAGKPDQYPPDSVTLDPQAAIYVVRTAEGFFALSAICTHLGCLTAYKPDLGIIACPCHGSKFTKYGVKIAGPAPRPLPRLHMWLNDDGNLMVDRSNPISINQLVRV